MTNKENIAVIEADLEEDVLCSLLEMWVNEHLDYPSASVFNDIAENVGIDLDELTMAVGKAVLNQIVVDAVEHKSREVLAEEKEKERARLKAENKVNEEAKKKLDSKKK